MTTTPEKIARILEAERRTGRRVDVSFNYRFAPTAARIKELLLAGEIGEVLSVDFHWYLDTRHGADYFRRWHAYRDRSGSLFVHKATHHFDLLNWYLDSDPEAVSAFADAQGLRPQRPVPRPPLQGLPARRRLQLLPRHRRRPVPRRPLRGPARRSTATSATPACSARTSTSPTPWSPPSATRTARTSPTRSTPPMPIEGHHIAFNGTLGRIELRQYEKQPWEAPDHDEILLVRSFPARARRSSASPCRTSPAATTAATTAARHAVQARCDRSRSASAPAPAPARCRSSAASPRCAAPTRAARCD